MITQHNAPADDPDAPKKKTPKGRISLAKEKPKTKIVVENRDRKSKNRLTDKLDMYGVLMFALHYSTTVQGSLSSFYINQSKLTPQRTRKRRARMLLSTKTIIVVMVKVLQC